MRFTRRLMILSALIAASFTSNSSAATPADHRYYSCDVHVISLVPDRGIESVQGFGSGSVGPGGKVTLGFFNDRRNFDVTVIGSERDGRFRAKVSLQPNKADTPTKHVPERSLDLSDLQPQVIELAKDDDGRIYQVNLVPRVISRSLPRQFRAEDLKLELWSFKSSQVVLNRHDLLGEMNMAGGSIGYVDIAGLAKVEFSLLPLTGAEAEGVLADGRIKIQHEGQLLTISSVLNGRSGTVLGGGPYKVWVRWLEPSQTREEYRVDLRKHLEKIKSDVASGSRTVPAGTIERLEKAMVSSRILMLSSGLKSPRRGDLQP